MKYKMNYVNCKKNKDYIYDGKCEMFSFGCGQIYKYFKRKNKYYVINEYNQIEEFGDNKMKKYFVIEE